MKGVLRDKLRVKQEARKKRAHRDMEQARGEPRQCYRCHGWGHNPMVCPTELDEIPKVSKLHGNKNSNAAYQSAYGQALEEESDWVFQPQASSRKSTGKPPKLSTFSGDSKKDPVSYAQWRFEVRTHGRLSLIHI